ncbi:MAG: glycoside hydrolase family 28 protein [Dysgonamonadaceae bacterium]|jgi:polygalacturonase|nr:glycoside hydrolase family 28 protein [Dysgonamonadaceae bacterium]
MNTGKHSQKLVTSNRGRFVLCASLLFFSFSLQAKTYNMQELGADVTGKNKCTGLINQTIQKAASEGGGTIYFPAGVYLTGPIQMESHITLHIESGAVVRFSDDFNDYLPFKKVRWEGVVMNTFAPLINAQNAENLTITGRGTLEGQGEKWWNFQRSITGEIRKSGKIAQPTELQLLWEKANAGLVVDDYYLPTIERRFFRPPFIQFYECKNITIEGVRIQNSPFWTINPEFCDNLVVHGVSIHNPANAPNTDGINPSSCSNVRISDCFIHVGDDCITIKSGRDAEARRYNDPCENITITNCVMLSGHGGVVIGSEMSGGVKKVTISNCVFHGTDAGIRVKSMRGRGGVVEEIRVDNIVMNDIQKSAFIFDLYYRPMEDEEVSERTPVFRNIHISNVTGNNIKRIGYIAGLKEMPVEDISFTNINMVAQTGFKAETAANIRFHNIDFAVESGASLAIANAKNIVLDDVRSKSPLKGQAIIELDKVENILVNNCFQPVPADIFCKPVDSNVIWGNNFLDNVKEKGY